MQSLGSSEVALFGLPRLCRVGVTGKRTWLVPRVSSITCEIPIVQSSVNESPKATILENASACKHTAERTSWTVTVRNIAFSKGMTWVNILEATVVHTLAHILTRSGGRL